MQTSGTCPRDEFLQQDKFKKIKKLLDQACVGDDNQVDLLRSLKESQYQKNSPTPFLSKNSTPLGNEVVSRNRDQIIISLLFKLCQAVDPTLKWFLHVSTLFLKRGLLKDIKFIENQVSRYIRGKNNIAPSTLDDMNYYTISFYRLFFKEIDKLGQGGFGNVYRANHTLDGKDYAIKKIPFDAPSLDDYRNSSVFQEIQIISKLDHPNICRYYFTWVEAGAVPVDNNENGEACDDHETQPISRQNLNNFVKHLQNRKNDLLDSKESSPHFDSPIKSDLQKDNAAEVFIHSHSNSPIQFLQDESSNNNNNNIYNKNNNNNHFTSPPPHVLSPKRFNHFFNSNNSRDNLMYSSCESDVSGPRFFHVSDDDERGDDDTFERLKPIAVFHQKCDEDFFKQKEDSEELEDSIFAAICKNKSCESINSNNSNHDNEIITKIKKNDNIYVEEDTYDDDGLSSIFEKISSPRKEYQLFEFSEQNNLCFQDQDDYFAFDDLPKYGTKMFPSDSNQSLNTLWVNDINSTIFNNDSPPPPGFQQKQLIQTQTPHKNYNCEIIFADEIDNNNGTPTSLPPPPTSPLPPPHEKNKNKEKNNLSDQCIKKNKKNCTDESDEGSLTRVGISPKLKSIGVKLSQINTIGTNLLTKSFDNIDFSRLNDSSDEEEQNGRCIHVNEHSGYGDQSSSSSSQSSVSSTESYEVAYDIQEIVATPMARTDSNLSTIVATPIIIPPMRRTDSNLSAASIAVSPPWEEFSDKFKKTVQNINIPYCLYLQMEHAGVWTLKDYIQSEKRIPNCIDITEIIYRILLATKHFHSHNLIHRDLKPSNVFINSEEPVEDCNAILLHQSSRDTPYSKVPMAHKPSMPLDVKQWTLKVGDFGLSKDLNNDLQDGSSPTFDSKGNLSHGMGTWPYIAPEQSDEEQEQGSYSTKVDMFSIGIILYELMMKTFTTSHERVDNLDSVRKGFFPTELLSQFPVLANLCQKFISPDPEKRPSAIEAIKIVNGIRFGEYNIYTNDELVDVIKSQKNENEELVDVIKSQNDEIQILKSLYENDELVEVIKSKNDEIQILKSLLEQHGINTTQNGNNGSNSITTSAENLEEDIKHARPSETLV